jgi:hypothetical protein
MIGEQNMSQRTTGVHEQQFYAKEAGRVLFTKGEGPKQYGSVMEEQLTNLEGRIDYMNSALETLEKRLAPVMRDVPSKSSEASLPCADSPLGRKLENFNSRMYNLQERILHIIESLEV